MVGGMTHKAEGGKRQAGVFSLLLICAPVISSTATAQVLHDPTRPPAEVIAAPPAATGAAAVPQLQSVMITPGERSAIIGGERVRLGGKFGEARVVKITESEVVLQSAKGSETLRMYPDVSVRPVEPAAVPASTAPAAKRRRPAAGTRGPRG